MFYTLGKKDVYEKYLRETPGAKKQKGGWALSLEEARRLQGVLRTPIGAMQNNLPMGEYNIYELSECTPGMVKDGHLLKDSKIGRRVE